jgi:threonyl-tRNA synthetase
VTSVPELKLTLPDGSIIEVQPGTTALQLAGRISARLAKDAVAAVLDGEVMDLGRPIERDGAFAILTFADEQGRDVYRHSASHVMAMAVKRLFPEARLAIGPAIADGFYYDFDLPTTLTPEDLARIEAGMAAIVEAGIPFERDVVALDEAKALFAARGESYKVELLDEIEDEEVTLYWNHDFVDLCRGPHLPDTGRLGAFKLLSVAGAYWRGDERNKMLQRIYGTAYPDRKQLEEHLARLEEARRRDHRVLMRDLDLVSFQDEVGPGLAHWHPKGAVIREIVEDFWRKEHRKRGYELVYTPHIGRLDLWETSGHLSWFSENMYQPMEVEGQKYMLKPMNCPFHILIYKSHTRSYRDLPIRLAELGTVYRYERSGVLHGMLRVRGFTQDDAHIFCRPDQLKDEIIGVIDLADYLIRSFGYDEYEMDLSVRDPQRKSEYIGDDAVWEQAEGALVEALESKGLPYKRAEGEAKFYGPAIDIKLRDTLGRPWQGPTIQVDFNEPERFDINFIASDGTEQRVVMVHRTVLGTMERFIGGLIEFYGGAFPTWLAPVQVVVLPIAERHHAFAEQVRRQLVDAGYRVTVDGRSETLGYRIREAQAQKVPYMLVVGDREAQQGAVAVRKRSGEDLGAMSLDEFAAMIGKDVQGRGQL